MPRNMSFSLTTEQIRNQTKTVTRRKGWKFLKPGDISNACVKCMGLKPGEKIEKICQIRVKRVKRERLCYIHVHPGDVRKEGFPRMKVSTFIRMFCKEMGGDENQEVTRIEFEYMEGK